jgi:membrane fusion protein (multidrug efflux system)
VQALKLQGEVPERFGPLVRVGNPVQAEVEAYPGRSFAGRISRVSPSVDVETRTFTVEASIPNPGGALKPGSFAKAALITGTDTAVPFVPEDAVASFAGIVKIFVIADGKADERRIKTGQRLDGWAEILEGVKVGETVATSNLSQLATGTAVQVRSGTGGGSQNGNARRPATTPTERPQRNSS